jgi:TRAP-type C4-dicarboxylate transport system substrate-binding protein
MKKLISLLLVVCMMLSLAACGGTSGGDTGDTSSDDSNTVQQDESGTAQDTSSSGDDQAAVPDASNDPAVTLTASSAFTATQLPGMFWEYFKEDVEKLSGGSITIDLYLGGTLGGSDEEMGMLSNGSIDMMMTFLPSNAFITPCIESIYYTPADIETSQKIMNEIFFENEESASVIADTFAANNATLLPFYVVTSDLVFASKNSVSSWSDMYSGKFGCPMDANYTDMGYQNLVTVVDADWYESLRTGICDSIQATAADIVSSKIYEVANTYIVCPATRVDHLMTINTDSLNKLTDNQKAVLYQACEDLLAYSAQTENDLYDQFESTVTEQGGTIINMTDEEFEWFMYCGNILGWRTGLETLATATDSVDSMTVVQEATKKAYNEYTDYDFDALAEKYDK